MYKQNQTLDEANVRLHCGELLVIVTASTTKEQTLIQLQYGEILACNTKSPSLLQRTNANRTPDGRL